MLDETAEPSPEQSYDDILRGLAPVLATLAKLAEAQHVRPPVIVEQSNGTFAIVPQRPPHITGLTGLIAAERRAAAQIMQRDARWRARTYTQAPSRPQLAARKRRLRQYDQLRPARNQHGK